MMPVLHLVDDFILAFREGLQASHNHPGFRLPLFFQTLCLCFFFKFLTLTSGVTFVQGAFKE